MKYVCVEICTKLRREIYNVTRQRTVEKENTFFLTRKKIFKNPKYKFFPLSFCFALSQFSPQKTTLLYIMVRRRERRQRESALSAKRKKKKEGEDQQEEFCQNDDVEERNQISEEQEEEHREDECNFVELSSQRHCISSASITHTARRLRLPFVQQKRSWDCGLACALMILRELSKGCFCDDEEEKNTKVRVRLRDLKAFLKGAESVWSIEIALALRAFGAKRVHFYTTEIGVKRQYKNERFYEKTFEMDAKRVKRAFAIAREKESGIVVRLVEGGMKDEWMEREVGEKSEKMLIVLVDKIVLENGYDDEHSANDEFRDHHRSHDGFVGHYVCVVGVKGDSFIIQDPARPEVVRVRKDVLHRARKSFGTDEDCIVVDRTSPNNRKQKERLDLAAMCDATRLVSKVTNDRNFEY